MANGINAARKLRTHRREQRWNDYRFKKAHSLEVVKKSPFLGASMASGHVVKRIGVGAKQPNSGVRKCVRVLLKKTQKEITAYVPRDGSINYIDEHDTVLVAGLGRSGHSVGDIPGCRFKVIAVGGISLIGLFRGLRKKDRR